ncbi:uncharacterized protein B0H18DRAFT_1061663, partial [Fomitopsis serialis]|uniref:uncharacterized protein n=1 Tax=Fomitopsis serialis TaxID=139415 RepID=UPI0020089BA4
MAAFEIDCSVTKWLTPVMSATSTPGLTTASEASSPNASSATSTSSNAAASLPHRFAFIEDAHHRPAIPTFPPLVSSRSTSSERQVAPSSSKTLDGSSRDPSQPLSNAMHIQRKRRLDQTDDDGEDPEHPAKALRTGPALVQQAAEPGTKCVGCDFAGSPEHVWAHYKAHVSTQRSLRASSIPPHVQLVGLRVHRDHEPSRGALESRPPTGLRYGREDQTALG